MSRLSRSGAVLQVLVAFPAMVACAEEPPWCDRDYHRHPACSMYGQVEVPPEVLAREEAELLAWCDDIYHQNVSCPLYGEVEVPPGALTQQVAENLISCDEIYHMNWGCPLYRIVPVPASVRAAERNDHLDWCASIDNANGDCAEPSYCDEFYYEDVSCADYAMDLPLDIVAERAAALAEWCEASGGPSKFCD